MSLILYIYIYFFLIHIWYTEGSNQAKRVKVDVEPTPENTDTGSSCVIISEALAKFLDTGGREMLRSEALNRVWEYIKVNHLEVGCPASQIWYPFSLSIYA